MGRYRILLVFAAGLLLVWTVLAHAGTKTDGGLLWVLPDGAAVKGLKPEDAPRQAKREGLYDLIDGGASVYLANGFKQALLQDYRSSGGTLYNLEVFEMDSPANAKKVFVLKGGKAGDKGPAGEAGTLEDYYGLFLQGRFFITVTASESTKEAKGHLVAIAKAVVGKIEGRSPGVQESKSPGVKESWV